MLEGIILPIILLIVGAGAFFIEVFVPSGGLIFVAALGSTIGGIVLAFMNKGTTAGMLMILAALVLIPVSFVLACRMLPNSRMGRRMMLLKDQSQNEGYSSQDAHERELLGKTGVALSNLRPAGVARIEDKKCDVVTEGEMIAKETEIEVIRVEGNRIVVRQLKK